MKTGFCAIVVLLVCCAFAFCAVQSQDCSQTGCVPKNAACNSSWVQNSDACFSSQGAGCCAYGLVCYEGICATNNVGAPCQSPNDCPSLTDQLLSCSNNTCKYLSYAGDFCGAEDTFCQPGFNCIDNVCTGQALGQPCDIDNDLDCDIGLYCQSYANGAKCQELLGEGDLCINNMFNCAQGLLCFNNGTNYACGKSHTLPEGAQCYSDPQCMVGYCRNGVCYEPAETLTPCATEADCPNGQACLCSRFTASSHCDPIQVNPCEGQTASALKCANEHNCHYLSANYGSCFSNNCFSQLVALQTCRCQYDRQLFGSCLYSEYCPGTSSALPDFLRLAQLGHNGASA